MTGAPAEVLDLILDPERYRSGRNGPASKAGWGLNSPTWVRIPPSPPSFLLFREGPRHAGARSRASDRPRPRGAGARRRGRVRAAGAAGRAEAAVRRGALRWQ